VSLIRIIDQNPQTVNRRNNRPYNAGCHGRLAMLP
jgi:hypothetical protein